MSTFIIIPYPNDPYIDRPLAQIPLKPTSSTTFAERALWIALKIQICLNIFF